MRASRFPLRLSVRYRSLGDPQWHEGKTENISRSGALFRAEESVDVDEEVEIRLALPVAAPGSRSPQVFRRGRVVRTVSPSDNEPWPGSAVAFENYDAMLPSAGAEFMSSPVP
jgi:hypothetical protein